MKRREFFKYSVATAGLLSLSPFEKILAREIKKKHANDIVTLGKTGIKVSRLAIGTGTSGFNYRSNQSVGLGINGLETARNIKTLPNYNNEPIIAVTALALKGDRERFLAGGCSHYLAKPFKKEELIKIISEALKN